MGGVMSKSGKQISPNFFPKELTLFATDCGEVEAQVLRNSEVVGGTPEECRVQAKLEAGSQEGNK